MALTYRNVDTFYLQYEAFRVARRSSRTNLQRQFAAYVTGNPVIFLNVLQAVSDWGNSVSQEAQSLAQYNAELARMERETGTILETHGIFFREDRFCSLGPNWLNRRRGKAYPRSIQPSDNLDRYPVGEGPAENFFDLEDYPRRLPALEEEIEPAPPLDDLIEPLPPVVPNESP